MTSETLADGTYILDEPVHLPEVLDLLIVGGGPAGTAAAFRAKELGLSALVVDYDDLMKRIRDYAKDKLILPDFGGGDKMKFPVGGELVSKLHFSPIDKDAMCVEWKSFYRTCNIPAQIGVELTGLERQSDGVWAAKAWNHKTKQEQIILTRHVAIAMGRGVPRRFDIPGNTDGISYKLDDAAKYVGAPALVIGGGTSAAEAVIAISNSKIDADDSCPVYWGYRGTRMPKVSKALSEVFFDAFVGNGNIRYRPNSEPVAVVTGPDRNDYLSLRVDRKSIDGRPAETAHLEFTKTFCVACIGEDLPVKFLNSCGIYMMTGGPKNKERMVVTPLLETQQPNVYLIGDILSQAYLETDDFNADPATFREIKHRGNVKSSLRDGVFIAEVVRQKVDGNQEIKVVLDFSDDESAGDGMAATTPAPVRSPSAPPPAAPKRDETDSMVKTILGSSPLSDSPPPQSMDTNRLVDDERAFLVRMTPGGIDEDEYSLAQHGITTIGRGAHCTISFPEDNLLSVNHASISHGIEGYSLRDDGSDSGTFLKLQAGKPMALASGDLVRVGQQILLFSENGGFSFIHYDHTGTPVNRYAISEGTIVLGRQAPDITLNPQDKVLSRRHITLSYKNGELFIKDLKSLNGSYLRVRDAIKIDHDDVFRAGQQIFRLSVQEEQVPDDATVFRIAPYREAEPSHEETAPPSYTPPMMPAPAAPASAPPAAVPTPSAPAVPPPATAPGGEPSVTFKGKGQSFSIQAGQTLCDAAEDNGIELNAECHAGICGSDPIRIVSGSEFLSPVDGEEADTLDDICDLEAGNAPGKCRLACMVKVTGPVVVEIVDD